VFVSLKEITQMRVPVRRRAQVPSEITDHGSLTSAGKMTRSSLQSAGYKKREKQH